MSVYRVADLVPARKIYVHCEVEVDTVYQRLFKKVGKGLHPTQHIPTYNFCMLILLLYTEGFGVKVHTVNSPMLFLAIV